MEIVLNKTSFLDVPIQVEPMHGVTFSNENKGHKFVVSCMRGGELLTLTGTVTARFMRANNTTILIAGNDYTGIVDGKAVVTLPQDCYNVAGRFQLTVFVTNEGGTSCVYAAVGTVQRSENGTLIDDGVALPSVDELQSMLDEIQQYETNIATAGAAQIAAVQAKGEETLDSIPDDYTALQGEVDDLKSAITEEIEASSNLFPGVYETGISLNADGSTTDNADRSVSGFIPVDAATAYYTHYGITQGPVNFVRVNCYGSDKTNVLGTTINANTFTTEAGTKYIRICAGTAYFQSYYALTKTSAANPYEAYRPEMTVVKTDSGLTDAYLPANGKATGDAIQSLEDSMSAEIAGISDSLDYIDTLKTNVYVREEPVNIMPSIRENTNILADGSTETNTSYAASSKFAVAPGKKIVFTRAMTSSTRSVERFKVVFFNGETVVSADVTMSASARNVPSTATHAVVGFYESYAASNYYPMVEYGDGSDIANTYSEYFTPYNNYKPSVTQRNSTKKLCVFGDSLAANGNGGNDYWAYIAGRTLGFSAIYNRGVGSSRVADTATLYAWIDASGDSYNRGAYAEEPSGIPSEYSTKIDACMSGDDRALTIPTDTDVLLILAGANDAATIGTIGIEAFKTAYRLMLDKIYSRVPDAKIYLCTPPFNANWDMGESSATYQSIRTAVRDMGQEYGYPVIDLKGEMMVNKNNYQTYMNDDGVHFNTASGRDKTAEAVIPCLYGYVYVE